MTSILLANFLLLTTIISTTYSYSTTTYSYSTATHPYYAAIYEQCAGDGFRAVPCQQGLTCFRRNRWFSSCQVSCPKNLGWECESYATLAPAISAAWAQCGGTGWTGSHTCPAGYGCYARSAHYSQCRPINDCPIDWACYPLLHPGTAVPAPVILAPFAKCNNVGFAVCPANTACFRSNDLYSECRPSCPPTWACETDVAREIEQCGGEGYVGITRCAPGLRCYVHSKWYSHCAASCPGADWVC